MNYQVKDEECDLNVVPNIGVKKDLHYVMSNSLGFGDIMQVLYSRSMTMELNSNEIAKINPHRYPFALVDRITDYKPGEYAKGIKCVSVNEMQFMGHFL